MAKDNRPTPDERSGRLPRRVPGAAGHSPGYFRRAHLPAPARHSDSEKPARTDPPPATPPSVDTLPRRVPGASPIQAPPPPPLPRRTRPPSDDLDETPDVRPADSAAGSAWERVIPAPAPGSTRPPPPRVRGAAARGSTAVPRSADPASADPASARGSTRRGRAPAAQSSPSPAEMAASAASLVRATSAVSRLFPAAPTHQARLLADRPARRASRNGRHRDSLALRRSHRSNPRCRRPQRSPRGGPPAPEDVGRAPADRRARQASRHSTCSAFGDGPSATATAKPRAATVKPQPEPTPRAIPAKSPTGASRRRWPGRRTGHRGGPPGDGSSPA